MSEEFERRVAAALGAPVPTSARARQSVMEQVRRAAGEGHPVVRERAGRWRTTRYSIVGMALAAGIGGVSTLSVIAPDVQRNASHAVSAVVLGDTVIATLHDTLRLVRLMFDAPSARTVAVAGDFAASRARPVPLVRDPTSQRWSVTLALKAGEHRYAFVVDETRWVPDPLAGQSVRGDDGRVYSLLNITAASN